MSCVLLSIDRNLPSTGQTCQVAKAYTEEQISEALSLMLLEQPVEVEKQLGIPCQVLGRWRKTTYKDRYEAMREAYVAELDKEAGHRAMRAATERLRVAEKTLGQLETALDENDSKAARDYAAADSFLMKSLNLGQQTSRQARDKPTSIEVKQFDMATIEAAIQRLKIQESIEGTATEVEKDETPELVEGSGEAEVVEG